jgi:hypothetical protein
MFIPAGGLTREKVRLFAGMSASVAEAVTLRLPGTKTTWSAGKVRTGAVLLGATGATRETMRIRWGKV